MAMIVSCRMSQCCYHNENGFCAKPIAVHIDQMGMCNVLWHRGQQKPFPPKERLEKDNLVIEDAGNVQLIKKTKKDDLLQKIQEKIS